MEREGEDSERSGNVDSAGIRVGIGDADAGGSVEGDVTKRQEWIRLIGVTSWAIGIGILGGHRIGYKNGKSDGIKMVVTTSVAPPDKPLLKGCEWVPGLADKSYKLKERFLAHQGKIIGEVIQSEGTGRFWTGHSYANGGTGSSDTNMTSGTGMLVFSTGSTEQFTTREGAMREIWKLAGCSEILRVTGGKEVDVQPKWEPIR